jgi:sarcosine oxidase
MREDWEPFLVQTRAWWVKNGIPHETLPVDEVRKRWPAFRIDDIDAVLYEPDAGVVRSRRATEAVAEVFRHEGGEVRIARVVTPTPGEFDGHTVQLANGDTVSGDAFVFACGPWLGRTFPVMANRMRTPLGTAVYYGTPPGDDRFTYPNMPSWNFTGTTGWPALPVDSRGFRVRGGSNRRRAPANASASAPAAERDADEEARMTDPDRSIRWPAAETLERPRAFVEERFPALADAPILETRSCHYELTSSRDFIVDRHPNLANVWIAGGGNAEGFKMGPVIGEYIARRVLGLDDDQVLAERFRIPQTEYAPARSGD